ncbi:hypothetical protein BZG36_04579 [Bifiguratus adelaidae]|uniref:Uncharacterized protein n=1 Tax=Bifiguratus adelaidae TaxID=1938954 RepID=A0A261XUN8_9FUNG|nr:hypothetical protein BZG36_04579 [Bifiguratus adelaidae]
MAHEDEMRAIQTAMHRLVIQVLLRRYPFVFCAEAAKMYQQQAQYIPHIVSSIKFIHDNEQRRRDDITNSTEDDGPGDGAFDLEQMTERMHRECARTAEKYAFARVAKRKAAVTVMHHVLPCDCGDPTSAIEVSEVSKGPELEDVQIASFDDDMEDLDFGEEWSDEEDLLKSELYNEPADWTF